MEALACSAQAFSLFLSLLLFLDRESILPPPAPTPPPPLHFFHHPWLTILPSNRTQVLLKRIEAGSFDDPAPAGAAGPQGQSAGTSVPSGPGGMNGPLPPPLHGVGLPPGAPQGLGGQPQWGGGGVSPRGGGDRGRSDEPRMGRMSARPGNMAAGDGGGAGGQGSSKRVRTSSGNGSGGGGPDGDSSPAGPAGVGNGNSSANTRSGGGRTGTPSQMDEAPPTMHPVLSTGMSQMVVTRPGVAAGGEGGGGAPRRGMGDRGSSLGFLPAFPEGSSGAPGSAAGAPASAVRLAQERSLPVGVTDPAEVRDRAVERCRWRE